jgi:ATP-dependent helicase/nuclease subunit B
MPSRVFLDWSAPFLPGLTAWLLAQATGPGAPDLSGFTVVLPTAQAGRRLRESLALAAGETGLLSPVVVTPEVLIAWGTEAVPDLAGCGELIAAWAAVLAELPLEDWRDLFPIDPVSQDVAWAVQAAGDLLKLRRTLEEGARTLTMAARDLGPAQQEAARWQALARLEALATARLEAGGWKDFTAARLAAADRPALPEDVRHVVLAGVPDCIRLVRRALRSLLDQRLAAVTVVVHAPAAEAGSFDGWGRPLPEIWTSREIALPQGNDSISLVAGPEEAARLLVEQLSSRGAAAIGAADPEISAPLRQQASAMGIAVYDPDGVPLLEHEVSWLMRTLTSLLRSDAWTAAGQLLRVPDVLAAAGAAAGARDGLSVLQEWDEFQAARLPQTLTQAMPLASHWAQERQARKQTSAAADVEVKQPVLPGILTWFRGMMEDLENGPLPQRLDEFLETVYHDRRFATGLERQRFTGALTAWQEALLSVERGALGFLPSLPAAARLDLAASLVRDARLYSGHAPEAQALHGWLELAWQDEPDLMIAGMNEGRVPDSIQGDAWLPDSVRGLLDLKTNDSRLARDSYLLTVMIESRRAGGSIQLVASRRDAAGDPLKPSRLLLRCPAAQLPARALRLFPREMEESRPKAAAPSWKRAWPLQVPPPAESAPVFTRLSVTAFGDYLKCPFRFYLKHVLKMAEYDASQAELDARAFGSLFHDVIQCLHQDPVLRDSEDEAALTAFLHQAMHRVVERTYGARLTIPVALQMDALRGCLTKAAGIHAAQRAAGWRFKEVEIDFPKLPGSDDPVTISGVEIRGRIDLIEEHPKDGLRILDYKTSGKAVTPRKAHLSKAKQEEDEPDWKFIQVDGVVHSWQNLQLPLYANIMSTHYGKPVAVGYVNLPRAISEARLEMWDDLTQPMLDAGRACAEGVIASIKAGHFWPPAERPKNDDFDALVFDGTYRSFDATQLKRTAALIAAGQFRPGQGL